MRVAVFGNDSGVGGAQTAFRRLCLFLQGEIGIDLAAIAVGGHADSEGGAANVVARILPSNSRSVKGLSIAAAAAQLRWFNPRIFISIGLANSSSALAMLVSAKTKCIAYDFIADREPSCRLLRIALKRFDRVILQSYSMKERLVSLGIDSRRLSTLPCFPGDVYPEFAKQGMAALNRDMRLAYFGRLARNKGVAELVGALAKVQSQLLVTLDIWGSGDESRQIEKLIVGWGLNDRICLRGPYPGGQRAAKLMTSYDAIAVPSQGMEGVPLVLVEAMALGVPALCADVGAIRDVCENNPDFILCQRDVESLADGILQLRGTILSQKINHDRLRYYFEKSYSHKAVAAQWRCLLDTLATEAK